MASELQKKLERLQCLGRELLPGRLVIWWAGTPGQKDWLVEWHTGPGPGHVERGVTPEAALERMLAWMNTTLRSRVRSAMFALEEE